MVNIGNSQGIAKNIASIFALAVLFFAFGNLAQAAEPVFYYPLDQTDLFKDEVSGRYPNLLESVLYTPAKFDYGAYTNAHDYYMAEATTTGTIAPPPGEWVCVSFWVKYITAIDPYFDTIVYQENISGTYSDYFSVNFKAPTGIINGLFLQMKWNDTFGNISILESDNDLVRVLDGNFHNVIICRQAGVDLGDLYIDGSQEDYTITLPTVLPFNTATGQKKYYIGGDYLFDNFIVDDLVLTRGRLTEQQVIDLQGSPWRNVYNNQTSTTTAWDFYLSDVNCCAGMACAVPITFIQAADGYTLTSGLDVPYCNPLATGTDYTFNYWAGTPASIVFPAAAAGAHTACLNLSNGGEPISATIQTINYYATTSPYCISNEIATTSFYFCEKPCEGMATTTNLWEGMMCGLKETGCWFIVPFENANSYISGSIDLLKTKFPANIFFNLTGAFEDGLQTTDDRTQTFGVPMIRPTATGSEFYILPVLDSSSTEDTIGKSNASLFRLTQTWFIWIAASLFCILFLLKKIKR